MFSIQEEGFFNIWKFSSLPFEQEKNSVLFYLYILISNSISRLGCKKVQQGITHL